MNQSDRQVVSSRRSHGQALLEAFKSVLLGRTNSSAVVQSIGVKVWVLGLNAATSIIVARALSPTGRGEMSAIILWPGFFASLLTLGLPSAVTMQIRKLPERSAQTLGAACTLVLLIGVMTGLVGIFSVPRWLNHYSATDIQYARWVLLASPLPMILLVGRSALEAAGEFLASNLSLWSAPVITLVVLLLLVSTGHAIPLTCGLAYTLGVVPAAMFLVWRVYKRYRPSFSGSFSQISMLLRYGLRAWGTDLLNALALSEHVLVVYFLTSAEMGTYVVVAGLARMLSVFQTSVVTVLLPRIAARDHAEVVSLTGFAFRITTACAVLFACISGALGPLLLRAVYGNRYAEGGTLSFRLLLAEVVLSGATQVMAQAYLALDRPGTITLIQSVGVGLGLAMMPGLIHQFGAAGAPCALLASSLIRLIATWAGLRLHLRVSSFRILINSEDLKALLRRILWLAKAETVAT